MYGLRLIRKNENMFDYAIVCNGVTIGKLDINENEDAIFIRHIGIYVPFRRQGHAKNVVGYIFEAFCKDIVFCIATNSDSAVKFWSNVLKEKTHEHIRGNIYKLKRTM